MSKRSSATYGNAHKRSRTVLVTGYNRATGGLTAAARSKKSLQRAVASAVRKTVEKKGVDTVLSGVASIIDTVNTNGDAICLNLVQQGAGSWMRIGRKITLESLRVRGTFEWLYTAQAGTNDVAGNVVRMVVVWDKQPSGAAIPTFDTVFGITDQAGTESTTFLNPVKYDNMDRFSVLRDYVCDLVPETNTTGGTSNQIAVRKNFDEFIPLKGREVVFLGQSAPMTIADISTGAIYVYFRVGQNVPSDNEVFVTASSFARLRYVDP